MQSSIKYLYKIFFKGMIISLVISVALISIGIIYGRTIVLNNTFLVEIGYYFIYGITLTVINALFFDYIYQKVVWKRYEKYKLLMGAAGSIVLTMVGIFGIRMFIGVVIEGEALGSFLANEKLRYYFVSFLITMIMSLFFHAFYFYKKIQENKVKEQKIIAGTASAKFESLKNQIDPHFLFNSLNVLSSLIEEHPQNAQKFTTSLSKIYRYVLEQKDKELVSVEEELMFAKTYMNLLKMRFENSLFYELPETIVNPDAKVVPLSLQLLLENTVKHNVVSENHPLHIRIFIDGDYLAIQNDHRKKEVIQDRQGVGLQNIINRYGIISKRKVLVEQNDKTFTVRIPILTKQISVMETIYTSGQESSYLKMQKKVDDIKGFYGNLASYILFTIGLLILNLFTNPQYLWFLYPGIGWGIGVVVHGLWVFDYMPFLGRDWEERKIRELMAKDKSEKWQ